MLTQQELADRAGVSLFTVQRIEAGTGNVRPSTGRAIAKVLGVGVEDLLPKAEAPPSQRTLFNGADEERRSDTFGRATRDLLELVEPFEAKLSAGTFTDEDRAHLDRAAALMTPLLQVAIEAEASFLREQHPGVYDVGPYATLGPAIVRLLALVAEVGGGSAERVRELEELRRTAYTAAA